MAAGDGGAVTITGAKEIARRMRERAARTRNLQPVMRVIGAEMVRLSHEAIDQSQSPDGERFPTLAESTRLGRKGARKLEDRLNRRTQAGVLTKGAQRARARFAAQELNRSLKVGGTKLSRMSRRLPGMTSDGSTVVWARPLLKSGRLYRSFRFKADARGCQFIYVGYGAHHARGTSTIPRRNPTVFRWTGGGWATTHAFMQWALGKMARYVDQGAL